MKLASLLLAGVSIGSMYGLVAMGFVIIYKASGVLNFAHGALVMTAAFAVAAGGPVIGFWPAVLAGIIGTALLAVAIDRAFIRPLAGRPVSATIVTIGIDIVLFTLLSSLLGTRIWELAQPWGGEVVQLGDAGITLNRLIGLIVAVVASGALLAATRFTPWGVEMRAVAADREAAGIVGIRISRVVWMSWAIAGLLAAIAAIFLTGAPTPGLTPALSTLALVAFPAAVLGGLTSIPGALVGGLVVGLAEALSTGYQESLSVLGRGFGAVVPFLILLIVLIVRPEGLFGERRAIRV